ncbi:hypothetical protein G6O69_09280 [Pseudenhygromyxa sp. WMMC2535]|uniref:hypothetical protein n=1 Tax=Pseudenhygromyxa sp. WMMC2535 TaxID=2712867 RepID=UPI001554C300|nr:hypothetical protein [Pseudenhygromyxa sp. WMMC2535]NVB38023.1 hypothetical protein [Pseudenhygromyxa sp. WMMC2535]
MSARLPRLGLGVTALAATLGCVTASSSYGARERYESPSSEAPPLGAVTLISAHLAAPAAHPRPPREPGSTWVEPADEELDRLILVFSRELDPLTVDPRAFAVLRGDGLRVAAVSATLAPADEGDENRSVTLRGYFGADQHPPVSVHVRAELFTEGGESLRGLDAEIAASEVPDRPVAVERLEPNDRRCPGAAAVLRTYWSDDLAGVGADDLAGISLRFADGTAGLPVDFDDQAVREEDEGAEGFPGLGPADDNVLDLCLDRVQAVTAVDFAPALFRDALGHPSAGARLEP